MVLSAQQIKERIEEPKHLKQIQQAILNEERVRFHTKVAISVEHVSSYYPVFKKWVQDLLPDDQFKRFMQLLNLPLATNEICDSIYSELYKVFKSGNKRIEFTFVRSEYQIDFSTFLEETKFDEKFELHAKELMRNYHNSIIVVDLPAEQTESGPAKPYYYDVSISAVRDIETDKEGKILMLLFKDVSGNYISIDTEKYCVFTAIDEEKNSNKSEDYVLLSENYHGLGFAPACFFWSQSIDKNLKLIKSSPINKSLASFDWYLFFHTSRKYLEMYASYPITSVIINDCDYKNEQGHTCEGGKTKYVTKIKDSATNNTIENETWVDCPACKNNRLVGPGAVYGVSAPSKDEPNLLEAVKRLPAERESLDYNQKEEERKKNLLILFNTGVKESDLKQAQNETQIIRGFESSQTILENVATNISKVHHFILHTFAKLRYNEYHVSTVVNYGDEFYEISEDEIKEDYKIALEGSAPIYEIDTIRKQIFAQKYKNDPRMQARIKILQDLEPWPTMSVEQVLKLPEKFIDAKIFSLKINLAKFVSIFESENGDIVDFASDGISYSKKIELIKQTLLEYGKDESIEQPE